MAGRNRFFRRPENFRGFHDDPRPVPIHRGPVPLPPPASLEEELDLQQREIQRLLSENRRVIDDNVMLERDLNAVKEEILRLNQVIGKSHVDHETYTREMMDRAMKLEADLRSYEALRLEIKQLRGEMQKLVLQKQEWSSKFQTLNHDINQLKTKNKQISVLTNNIDKIHKEVIDTRRTYDYEKKGNEDLVEQNRALEGSIVSMAREIELLRAELPVSTERSSRGTAFAHIETHQNSSGIEPRLYAGIAAGATYAMVNGSPESGYHPVQYSDVYANGSWTTTLDNRVPPRR